LLDPQKVITMTKLAIYDKEGAEEDLNIDRFFRHDYIYRQNMWIRLYLLIGCLVVIGLRVLHMLAVDQADLFALDFRAELIKAAVFILIVLVGYTIIGTIQYTVVYERSQRRMREYFALLDELTPPAPEEDAPEPPAATRREPRRTHGTASMDTRKHNKLL